MSFENIPNELRQLNQWVCWKIEERKGKSTKVPVNPRTGGNAMANNPDTWGSYQAALEGVNKFSLLGIGFVFNGDGVVGVDIDKCRDPETGVLTDEARDIICILDSYTEISQSGTGIHILCRGQLPGGKRRRGSVEMYETERFFIMTGNILDDGHSTIEERTEALARVHAQYLADEQKKEKKAASIQVEHNMSDDEIIEKASNAKNGSLFSGLMKGSWKGLYASQSEADMALCNMLAFWTNCDAAAMDRIFHRSGLYRDKWDEKRPGGTYGSNTIAEAIRACSQTYTPSKKEKKAAVSEAPEMETGFEQLVASIDEQLPEWILGPYNDMWNAERLIERHGKDIKFNKTKECWYLWNNKYWEEDSTDKIRGLADDAILKLYQYDKQMYAKYGKPEDKTDKRYANFIGWLSKSRNTGRKDNMIKEAQSWPGVATLSDAFDSDIWLLNCLNGTLDLRTGNLLPHSRNDLITKIVPVEYDPNAKAPVFEAFINRIFDNKKSLIEFIQRAIGYSLTGSTREQSVFVCHGSGANGKSTLINIIQEMMGDYARNTNFTTFTVKNDSNTNDIARLMGARFVTAMEVGEDKRLNEALIKQLSGGDKISARYLHKEFFDFMPTFKIWMGANHKPKIKETDNGIWRRIKLIPFDVTIPEHERDGELPNKLKKELPGILAWAVQGCLMWQKDGLKPPAEVCAATDEYREEMDVLQSFLVECTVSKKGEVIQSSDLYRVYEAWCDKNGEYKMSLTKFATKLKERGIKKGRTKAMKIWEDIQLSETGKRLRYGASDYKKQNEYIQETLPWD